MANMRIVGTRRVRNQVPRWALYRRLENGQADIVNVLPTGTSRNVARREAANISRVRRGPGHVFAAQLEGTYA